MKKWQSIANIVTIFRRDCPEIVVRKKGIKFVDFQRLYPKVWVEMFIPKRIGWLGVGRR